MFSDPQASISYCSAAIRKFPPARRAPAACTPSSRPTRAPIEIEFFASEAPKAVENFRLLAEHGYYDGLTFHRIVRGFMIQGGDPDR